MRNRCSVASTTSFGIPSVRRPDVGGAAGQGGERRARAHEAVGRLVHGAVAAERHDHVVALDRCLATDLGRVAALLRVDRLHGVARPERVDHEVRSRSDTVVAYGLTMTSMRRLGVRSGSSRSARPSARSRAVSVATK